MSDIQSKRLAKEIKHLVTNPPPGVTLIDYRELSHIIVGLIGAEGTIYSGEKFQLQFKFPTGYPMDSPEVTFIHPYIPKHPHVYSNGHICLSILYDQWSPGIDPASSMLSSCVNKDLPPDNDKYVSTHKNKSPKDTKWWFHDDKV